MNEEPDMYADCEVSFTAIGIVKNAYDGPTSGNVLREAESRIVINEALQEGLIGLEVGQSIMVVFYFHRSPKEYELLQHPRGDNRRPKRGVFALRSPRRPNRIGITIVDLLAVEANVLRVRGVDAINNTPVLDIKPA